MKKFILFATLMFAFLLQSCGGTDENVSNTARVQLKLVDASGDYQEVNVEIVDVLINNSEDNEGWISITPEGFTPVIVDLTKLIAGNELLLADVIIPSGMLKQVRLILGNNNTLLVEGEAGYIHLDTPSAQQSGLKLKINTTLEPGYSYTFILDWDVQKSIVKAGNSGKYLLKPVIRVIAEVNSGSIKGQVVGRAIEGVNNGNIVPLKNAMVSVYTVEKTYITQTRTNENGNFIIRGLDPGDYLIKIEHDSYIEFTSEIMKVTVGETLNIGTIELLVPVN